MRKLILATAAGLALAASAPAFAAGEIIVTYKDDVSTLDPAIGYDWQNWSIIKSLFDGLMDYKPGTTELVPDLAESYEISPDGKTFTFKLRPGVKFTNGRELTAEDVKYSIERVLDPATQSPGAGFFGTIDTIEVVDPQTIRFELNRPDATFLHVMAINFAHVVPKEAVEAAAGDFGHKPVGSGAYKVAEWTLGQRLVLEKNADYWKPDTPKLDKITFEFGQEPNVALLRLERGEVDVLGDGIPPAQFLEVKDDPQYARPDHRGRPAPHRLRDDERQHQAVRRRAGPPGGQHGDQQGSHRPHHQQPRGAGQPAAAAVDAGLHQGPQGLRLRPRGGEEAPRRRRPRRRLRDRALRLQHRPQPAHRPGDPAGPRRGRHQGRAQVAGPGQRHRRRRRRLGADDLVGRHGLDRRLPRSVRTSTGRSSAAAARSRAAGTGRGTATRTSTPRPRRPTR